MFLRNVGIDISDYKSPHTRKQQSSQSSQLERQFFLSILTGEIYVKSKLVQREADGTILLKRERGYKVARNKRIKKQNSVNLR
jgi:hypothetical protein